MLLGFCIKLTLIKQKFSVSVCIWVNLLPLSSQEQVKVPAHIALIAARSPWLRTKIKKALSVSWHDLMIACFRKILNEFMTMNRLYHLWVVHQISFSYNVNLKDKFNNFDDLTVEFISIWSVITYWRDWQAWIGYNVPVTIDRKMLQACHTKIP